MTHVITFFQGDWYHSEYRTMFYTCSETLKIAKRECLLRDCTEFSVDFGMFYERYVRKGKRFYKCYSKIRF